ncbi:LysE family transporter [Moorena sp. SIO4G3]|uniref:LysE family translocator n=1 Tax=Moorena sp. SIO4G3 TaxID=2607821 RepID=UPI0013CC00FB|nr:LysE family transporter [Moorena sp. SIO4G3]NEO81139.1 LysE family transporter [Moorena sp. SIO4G3]NEO91948.1 LysE family transporter [Moorena sp. SIO3G5]
MITKLLLSGIFIGFFIALPFGGNAVLCTKNTLSYGGKSGLATGLGAATAHTAYSFIGFSGLVAVKSLLSNYLGILEIIGGFFLCYFGVSSIRKDIFDINADNMKKSGLIKTYLGSTLFALTNPKSIIVASILITESEIFNMIDYNEVFLLSVILSGIFMGSAFWWLILVTFLSLMKKLLNPIYLVVLNRIAGALVIFFGLFFSVLGFAKIWLFPHSTLQFMGYNS